MFKWGLFKKDLRELDLPADLKREMKSIDSEFSDSHRVVLAMDQLTQLIRERKIEFETMKQRAEELELRLGQVSSERNFQADLLTSMCDEIQAPIHTINQLGDWLDQTHLDPNQRACFNFYRMTARKLHHLFKNMIDVAQLREGIFQLDPISFQLHPVVREIMQTLNLTAQEKGIPLKVSIDPDVPQYLIGDIKRLEQILVSLVNNAIKFTYEGEVEIKIQKGKDSGGECIVKFLVMDSGMGIPEDQIDSIFDRLTQGDPDVERNYGGTGLGLYICKSFVEQMGGSIWAENRKEGGAVFGFSILFEKGSVYETSDTVILTGEDSAPQEDAVAGFGEKTPAPGSLENRKMKILVVDDCEDTCKLIARFLENGPYDVDVVHDGVAAIEQYDDKKYDLILMDIQLPRLDGVRATMEIRQKESETDIHKTPIFALVGNPDEAHQSYYMAADFDCCLIKPVSRNGLYEAIGSLTLPQ